MDYAKFYKGNYAIEEPSAVSDFMIPFQGLFPTKEWYSFSPKAGLRYTPNEKISSYVLYSRGFRPPMLDDLCRSGNVNKGLKIANPYLNPETINNMEVGFRFRIKKTILVEPTFYYSIGNDLMYFVGTGDSTYTGGDQLKPVLKRDNIGKAEIIGSEFMVTAVLFRNLEARGTYAFNHSVVTEFDTVGHYGKDLSGTYLIDVPVHQSTGGLFWKNRFVNTGLTFFYRSSVWTDDENTIEAEGLSQWNLKLHKKLPNGLNIAFNMQNIFNVIYISEKGTRSPGRVFLFEISYHFQSKNKF
jgi:iron complex outermembrane receptor protein